jgi:phosphoglycolate phosphatase-like HAD superfamily hydrolase
MVLRWLPYGSSGSDAARNGRVVLIDSTVEAVVFDWDGTAVPDRLSLADGVRRQVEALCTAAVHLFVVSGANIDNIDGQLDLDGGDELTAPAGDVGFEQRRRGDVHMA